MARLNVNPTRMELKRLKARLSTSVRGHKLLKDKSDEMIRRFSEIIRENKKLRDEVELQISNAMKQFMIARSISSEQAVEGAFLMPSTNLELSCEEQSIMGVNVPKISCSENLSNNLPYAYFELTSEADFSVEIIMQVMPKLLKLAEIEKTVRVLASEIERNKRRVNALEYVMIPQLEETIKYIKDKLDENERASVIRMMKVKNKAE